ncbi:unnamed protein product, partial [Ceratitis capitata]
LKRNIKDNDSENYIRNNIVDLTNNSSIQALEIHHIPALTNIALNNKVDEAAKKAGQDGQRLSIKNDAAAGLAFGHFNGEKEVNEPYGSNDKHNLGHLPWNPEYIFVDEALKLCDALEITGSPQRLIMPIMRTMDAKQVYDVFPVIVPNAGRGNPENSSELLTKFLDKYRQT